MKCLYCDNEYVPTFSWCTFMTREDSCPICETCQKLFYKIEGEICEHCGRPWKGGLCGDCERWKRSHLQFNRALFSYNQELKEWMNRFKFRGDVALVQMIEKEWRQGVEYLANEIDYVIPIPLSEERLYERSFNQAFILAERLPFPMKDMLKRRHSEKQSKKGRWERFHRENVFYGETRLNGERIVLIDDLYTTGVTLHQAADVLKSLGAGRISSYTVGR